MNRMHLLRTGSEDELLVDKSSWISANDHLTNVTVGQLKQSKWHRTDPPEPSNDTKTDPLKDTTESNNQKHII